MSARGGKPAKRGGVESAKRGGGKSAPAVRGSRAGGAVRHRHALRRHGLHSFFELSQELDCSQDTFSVADLGLLNFMGHLGTARAALWLAGSGNVPVLVRAHGLPETVVRDLGDRCIAPLLQSPQAVRRLLRIDRDGAALDGAQLALLDEAGMALVATFGARGALLGAVALGGHASGVAYDDLDIDVLQASIDFLGVAIENARLGETLRENNRRLRHTNEGLEETNRTRVEFMAEMRQQLRAPLAVMYAYLEALAEELPQDGEPHAHMRVAMSQAIKLKRIVLDLLDLSGLKEESLITEVKPGDLLGSLQAYVDDRRPGVSLQLRELRLHTVYDAPQAPFDGRRLCQVLDILVDQAIEATPSGGCVTVHARSDSQRGSHWARIDVESPSASLLPERLPDLMNPIGGVSQALLDPETDPAAAAMLLARHLAEAMGGWLELASDPERGTVFSVFLAAG